MPLESISPALRAKAVLELRRRERLKRLEEVAQASPVEDRDPFGDWLKVRSPGFQWDLNYLRYIRQKLARIESGLTNRQIFNLPPQHGKSQQITIRYPVYLLEKNPSLRIGIACYAQFLANKFSRSARRIARGHIDIASDRNAVEEWETSEGGVYRAVGRGGGISGQPFDYFFIDDLIKGRKEADSQAIADEVKEWYAEEVYPRAKRIVYVGTRWGSLADPVGYWLDPQEQNNAEGWEVYNIPAEAEEDDPLGRPVGAPLSPELGKDAAFLAKSREVQGLAYYALYQGRPVPKGGKMFREEYFRKVESVPRVAEARIRYWDRAGSVSDDAARTAGVLMTLADNLYYVEDVVKGKWETADRNNIIRETAIRDRQMYGGNIKTWIEQEPGFTGQESVNITIRRLAGFDVSAERVTGEKAERAGGYSSMAAAGNVRMKIAPWNKDYVEEAILFPNGKYKDQIDASSGAFNKLAEFSEGALI